MSESQLSSGHALTALERFVVENDDLLSLEERIGRFNIFDALGIARAEIRHSNFLAWLLDPAESHGQGSLFLKAILMDLLKQSPPERRPLSPIELDGEELRGVRVRREWRQIDILITCEQPRFVVAIENKVDAGEHGNQLDRYQAIIDQHFQGWPRQLVFLTQAGEEASSEHWVSYTYGDVYRVLTRVRNTGAAAIGDDVMAFLDHYLRLIGSRFMDDAKIDELCQRIYRNHRQALELIFDRCGSPSAGLLSAVEGVLLETPDRWRVINRTSRAILFIPVDWLDAFPPIGARPSLPPSAWIVPMMDVVRNSLRYRPTAMATSDPEMRRRVIDLLTADRNSFGLRGLGKNRKTMSDGWTRLHNERILEWPEDEPPDEETIAGAVRPKLDEIYRKLAAVPAALTPMFGEHALSSGRR